MAENLGGSRILGVLPDSEVVSVLDKIMAGGYE
jgi:hypothetical protein